MAITALSPFGNRDVANLIFETYSTGVPFLNLDFANVTTTDLTGETVYAYGGSGHPKRISFQGERGGTIKIDTQMQCFKLYQLLTGATLATTGSFIKREVLTAAETTLTLSATPANNDEVYVFASTDDCGTPVEATATGTSVTVPSAGTYIVYYTETLDSGVLTLSIKSTTFPDTFKVYMETLDKTEAGTIAKFRMTAYKCSPQTNFTITQSSSGDPGTISITCDLLADQDNNMLDMQIVGA